MRRHTCKAWMSAAVVLAAAGLAAGDAAAGLGKEACDALKTEHAKLTEAGVPQTMQRGAEWAKANLGRDRLDAIRRYIEVGEQIMFRCDRPKPVNVKIEQAETDGEEKPKEGESPSAAPSAAPAEPQTPAVPAQPKAAPKPRSQAPAIAPAHAAAAAATPAVEAMRTRPAKPAAKINDAYVPAPAQPQGLGGLDAQARRGGDGAWQQPRP